MNKILVLILTSAMSLLTLNACEKQDPDSGDNTYMPITLLTLTANFPYFCNYL